MLMVVMVMVEGSLDCIVDKSTVSLAAQCCFSYDSRRPFLLPSVKALLRMAFILLSLVGDVGLGAESLPERVACDPSDDDEVDLLRPSSARMSSRETLR